MEELSDDLLLSLHSRFPNAIDDNARLLVEDLIYEKGKAHGCIYSGKTSIINKAKGIQLDFSIWFDVYCAPYGVPEIRPDIKAYLTGEYGKRVRTSENVPELDLKAVILLNIPEPSTFSPGPMEQRYFDANWQKQIYI